MGFTKVEWGGGGTVKSLLLQKKGQNKFQTPIFFSFRKPPSTYLMIIPFENVEYLILLSLSEIKQELC